MKLARAMEPRMKSAQLRSPGWRLLGTIVLGLASGGVAEAQWDKLDQGAPNVLEMIASTNLIVDRWALAAQHYELVLQREPDHPWGAWLATHSLVEGGEYVRALQVGGGSLDAPRARARVAYELARAAAGAGDLEKAAEYLVTAREAQLVMPAKLVHGDKLLAPLKKTAAMRELLEGVEDVAGRFSSLADAEDHGGLVLLCHGSLAMAWSDLPTVTWVLKDVVDEHGRAKDRGKDKDAAVLAKRLELGARAADDALGVELHTTWIRRALAWSEGQREEDADLWKAYSALGSKIRGHRFAQVLESLEELEGRARRLGDFMALYMIDRTRGMVHSGILNYRQARKGVSREEEYRLGREAFLRRLDWARKLDDVDAIVDAYDFLATFETQAPHLSLAEGEQLIFGGIIASARVQPEDRELGMFEGMWRDLQEIER